MKTTIGSFILKNANNKDKDMSNSNTKISHFSAEARFIENLIAEHKLVSIYLVSGIKLQVYIVNYDKYTILAKLSTSEDSNGDILIYKHAISTIVINSDNRSFNRQKNYNQINKDDDKKGAEKEY